MFALALDLWVGWLGLKAIGGRRQTNKPTKAHRNPRFPARNPCCVSTADECEPVPFLGFGCVTMHVCAGGIRTDLFQVSNVAHIHPHFSCFFFSACCPFSSRDGHRCCNPIRQTPSRRPEQPGAEIHSHHSRKSPVPSSLYVPTT